MNRFGLPSKSPQQKYTATWKPLRDDVEGANRALSRLVFERARNGISLRSDLFSQASPGTGKAGRLPGCLGPCECRGTGILGRLGSRGTPSRIELSLRPPWLSRARLVGPLRTALDACILFNQPSLHCQF